MPAVQGRQMSGSVSCGEAMDAKMDLLLKAVETLKVEDHAVAAPVEAALSAVQRELSAMQSQNHELSGFTEQALEQAEKLKIENEDLRKAKEDAVMEGQLAKKLSETEKLATASTAYKKDLLQQSLAKKDQEVQKANDRLQAAERQIKSLTTQLSDMRRAHREAAAKLEDLEEKRSANAASQTEASLEEQPTSRTSTAAEVTADRKQGLGNEHEALAARLLEGGVEKLDSAALAAAAAGLRDTSVLEKQLKRARDENERLQKEIQQLNETVFSKSFKAPSAWAEREVKYKAEKRAWEQQVASLKEKIKALAEENEGYRASNKTAEFENQVKELKASVKKAEAERTTAQQALHEIQLQLREASSARTSSRNKKLAPEDAHVHSLISVMEEQGIGVQTPRVQKMKATNHQRSSSGSALHVVDSTDGLTAFPVSGANLQELIEEYDDQGIGISGPARRRKSIRRKPEAFTALADAVAAGDLSDDSVSVDLEGIKHGLRAEAARSKAGSDLEGEASFSRRRTWSTELPDLPLSTSSGGHTAEPSRLQNVTSASQPSPVAIQGLSKHPGYSPGSAVACRQPGNNPAASSTSTETSKPDTIGDSSSPEETASRAEQHGEGIEGGSFRAAGKGIVQPGSAPPPDDLGVRDSPGTHSSAPIPRAAAEDSGHPLGSKQTTNSNQQVDQTQRMFEQVDAGPHQGSEPEALATPKSVRGAVEAHGYNPALPALHEHHRDWVSQGKPLASTTSESAQPGPDSIPVAGGYSVGPEAGSRAKKSDQADVVTQGAPSHDPQTSTTPMPASADAALVVDQGMPVAELSGEAGGSGQVQVESRTEESGSRQPTESNEASTFLGQSAERVDIEDPIREPRPDPSTSHPPPNAPEKQPQANGSPDVTTKGNRPAQTSSAEMQQQGTVADFPPPDSDSVPSFPGSQEAGESDPDLPDSAAEAYRSYTSSNPVRLPDPAADEAAGDGAGNFKGGLEEAGMSRGDRETGAAASQADQSKFADSLGGPGEQTAEFSGRQIGPEKRMPSSARRQPSGGPTMQTSNPFDLGPKSVFEDFSEIEPLEDGSPPQPLQRLRTSGSAGHLLANGKTLTSADSRLVSRASSEEDSPWTEEKRSALQAEKKSVEAEWREHVADQDVGTLKWRAAELESRVEMHEAQILKMQRALERADQEKAKLEEDLETAMSAASSVKNLDPKEQQGLNLIRDRMRKMASMGDQLSTSQRAKETEGALQEAYREVQTLQRQRDELQKQLANIATKINSGMIPDPVDLTLPGFEDEAAPAAAAATTSRQSGNPSGSPPLSAAADKPHSAAKRRAFASFVGGLSDEEIEVMGLRQENENMMETLVRTKVELAETQGDYLKMRRALIRAVEKQAALADRLDSLKAAVAEGDKAGIETLISESLEPTKVTSGDIQSLGERS